MLALLGRGLSEKEVASELSISPSRVTQHVRALKDRLGTERRSGLVAAATELRLYGKLAGEKFPVPDAFKFGEPLGGDLPDRAMLSDAAASFAPARWNVEDYDRVGPGALDGKGAVLRRAILILLLGLGAPILILLVQAAMVALSSMRI